MADMYLETETYKAGQFGKDLEDVEGEHKLCTERHLRRVVAELGDDVLVEIEVVVGEPADSLIAVSSHLDLLAMGARGYGLLRAVLLGSVSRRVTAAAHCPVVVLPRGVRAPAGSTGRGGASPDERDELDHLNRDSCGATRSRSTTRSARPSISRRHRSRATRSTLRW